MDKCFLCQDFKINVGHDTESCPQRTCKKCGQCGHSKLECMAGFEIFPLPNEIIFKIFDIWIHKIYISAAKYPRDSKKLV